MKLSMLAEAILETITMDCEALKREIEDTPTNDPRGERVSHDMCVALDDVIIARNAYKTMHRDVALELKRRKG